MSLVSPSSVKCAKDKSRAGKEKWAAFSFTLNSSFPFVAFGFEIRRMTLSAHSHPRSERAWASVKLSE